ncbi:MULTISPECIES: prolyl oligopeptidase family serine peptidase [Pseudidiomarina]|uniref:Glutamyl peptidase n=2 Tax=Pseudidiomarina TaxID=2800384 RepID=A0A368UWF7_9GAMM|nr:MULTISPECIES: prolyl oligopeptidase family serine peptidase [Pseudidiomarina]PWW13671.1 glutamyl peptidase [Pseudidiomarina maritima]RBP91065.1 glutamyl peptidase [Pseudidiomarina tainanensis]RCW33079.1 glutamyl peptidase [Pseudidiomarina tainanensis]
MIKGFPLSACASVLAAGVLALSAPMAAANPVKINYQQPAQDIIDIVDAAPSPGASLSPDGSLLLVTGYPALPDIYDMAADQLKLAGRRINPANYTVSQARYISELKLVDVATGNNQSIQGLPADLKALAVSWAPNGRYIALAQQTEKHVELWLVDVAKAKAKRWSKTALNAVWGARLAWLHDSSGVYTYTVVDGLTKPAAKVVPTGPVITESKGRTAPGRTYQDLLQNKHDEDLFDYYFTSQIKLFNVKGKERVIGEPAVYNGLSVAPSDDYLLVSQLKRPYSYAVPHYRFPETTEVWSPTGKLVYQVVEQGLADNLPIAFDAVVQGRRSISWRNDADATLVWAEAADQGDPAVATEVRDQVFQLAAPFKGQPQKLADLSKRFSGLLAADNEHLLIWERWWADRDEKLWLVDASGKRSTELVWERSWEDRYNDPGTPFTVQTDEGRTLLYLKDGNLLLRGSGASDEGDRPFIDSYNLMDKTSERLWRSEAPYYEAPRELIDAEAMTFLTQREGVNDPADFFIRDIDDNKLTALTETPHPMPHTLGITREQITYTRDDGLPMSAELYLPAGYDKDRDGPLPTIVWAYPREYKSSAAAAQISGSPYEFVRISYWSPQYLATQGYAVLDAATMPIVGEGDAQPNDTFIEQLVMNGKAAIDAGAKLGVTDPERVALGGHSYGAFMTANMLAHSDLFKTGIARSGAYNRSLTPFGFQREERTVWDDADLYIRMSPFFHADKINEPLLMIHGINDNNSGTFPMQSERLYQAIKGLGGTARLVMLPHESHGYRARESVLHMLWEQTRWLDEHLKGE